MGPKNYIIVSQAIFILIFLYQNIPSSDSLREKHASRSPLESVLCANACREKSPMSTLTHIFGNTFQWRDAEAMHYLASATKLPLITVIMTVRNNANYLSVSIASIMGQSYPNIELIIVDDASNDTTPDVIKNLTTIYSEKLRFIRVRESRGTYFGKNLAMLEARGEYITFQDSDDISHVDRIAIEYFTLIKTRSKVITVDYVRVRAPHCSVILNRGVESRPAYMSMLFHINVTRDIGYFDTVMMSADDEFYVRARRFYNIPNYRIARPYYIASVREGSITNNKHSTRLDLSTTNITLFLGDVRSRYVAYYESWHRSAGRNLFIPFPLLQRKFPAPKEHLVDPDIDRNVTVSIASTAGRTSLNETLASLIDQVDRIYLYLNNYETIPAWLKKNIYARKVIVVLGSDIKDNGKVYFLANITGYHFTCDDDLVYPPNYVQRMIAKIEQHARRIVVGVHAINMTQAFWSNTSLGYYQKPSRNVTHFRHAQYYDTQVHILGTGTIAYHTNTLAGLEYKDFPVPGMLDIWFAIQATRRQVPLINITRPQGWIREIKAQVSIWNTSTKNDTLQTRIVRSHMGILA